MNSEEKELGKRLARVFENVLLIEEKSLHQGYFPDLSLAEMHTLDAIGPYEARTMTETAEDLGITTGTLTVSINRLLRKGYVSRNRDESDRRIVRISLTKKGKIACRMHSKFHAVLARHVLEPYDSEEQKMLIKLVDDIDEFLSAQVVKYNDADVKKTASEVATQKRRRKDNG